MVVVGGSPASFSCFTDSADKLCWRRYDRRIILCLLCNDVYGCRDSRFSTAESSVDNNLWRHSLTIDSCNATDSGRYWCQDCRQIYNKKLADLTVLGWSVLAIFI